MTIWKPEPKIIRQTLPNQPIILYRGFTELIDRENIIEGKSWVQISWYPYPTITVKFVYKSEEDINLKDVELKLTELIPQARMSVHLSKYIHYCGSKKTELFGYLTKPFRQGITDNLSSVTFHITNFFWFNISNIFDYEYDQNGNEIEIQREGWLMFDGQFIFDYDNWHFVLATLDENGELEEKLEAQGGYGVTHICKLERSDEQAFNLDEANKMIDAFVYYLSFVRGIWVSPLLIYGWDAEGNKILEEWSTPKIKADSWQSLSYCWTTSDTTEMVIIFPKFMKKWEDENWKETIQNAIQWYVESYKHSNGYNTSIILIQSALEKLAWTYLKTNQCVNSEDFNGLKASGQIRLLLKFLNIPLEPVDKYLEINKKAKELNWMDSIKAITEIRNAIIHPPSKNNKNNKITSEQILTEVFQISHYYLQQCLLKIFEYPYI
ncbi:hypothetical protein [Cyanobacterium sp. Dongsha4]|uniref:hypothetical protein n=1 Tax=Cyanobacterium sp. DS4 TaxID=2878255 RepID=UPI002E810A5B|nr:hypothetical protein [Cyanobacterium sp. Dongsha4]WVL00416.1 hypothetical protein Dongsha4_17490 [Cyanobacterium sp. Dongsha4]